MEPNTVVITLDRYEGLKEAEEKLRKPRKHTLIINGHPFLGDVIYTDDETVAEIAKRLRIAYQKISKLKEEINGLKEDGEDIVEKGFWERMKQALKLTE